MLQGPVGRNLGVELANPIPGGAGYPVHFMLCSQNYLTHFAVSYKATADKPCFLLGGSEGLQKSSPPVQKARLNGGPGSGTDTKPLDPSCFDFD